MIEVTNVFEMPWEENLSVDHMRFGKPSPKARGKWKKARVRKPEVQGWMDRLAWEVKLLNIINYGLPLTIIVDFRFPDERRRDDHNYYKAICDAVATGLDLDDRHIRIRTGTVVVDRENPGFTITLTDEEAET